MATDTASVTEKDMHAQDSNLWEGGTQPFKVSYGKLMMWYFLLSDAFTFAGFLIAYGALRFSMPTWPVPDFVFSTIPDVVVNALGMIGLDASSAPLIFVTFMTFVLIISSVTMVRAVQEGHRENKNGVIFWMLMTIIGGAGFLGCQAWEWTKLIGGEHMTVATNPFGTHSMAGTYLDDTHGVPYAAGVQGETFDIGDSYLLHKAGHGHGHGEAAHGDHDHAHDAGHASVDTDGFIKRRYKSSDATDNTVYRQELGPKAFGALFFFITGFHGFHVLSGVAFLLIILINVASGLYVERKNGYEMVEKIGLYWHFVDLVWVFVFLVFYLL